MSRDPFRTRHARPGILRRNWRAIAGVGLTSAFFAALVLAAFALAQPASAPATVTLTAGQAQAWARDAQRKPDGLFPIPPLTVPAWPAFGTWLVTIDAMPGLVALM